jgi:hypothetical protein
MSDPPTVNTQTAPDHPPTTNPRKLQPEMNSTPLHGSPPAKEGHDDIVTEVEDGGTNIEDKEMEIEGGRMVVEDRGIDIDDRGLEAENDDGRNLKRKRSRDSESTRPKRDGGGGEAEPTTNEEDDTTIVERSQKWEDALIAIRKDLQSQSEILNYSTLTADRMWFDVLYSDQFFAYHSQTNNGWEDTEIYTMVVCALEMKAIRDTGSARTRPGQTATGTADSSTQGSKVERAIVPFKATGLRNQKLSLAPNSESDILITGQSSPHTDTRSETGVAYYKAWNGKNCTLKMTHLAPLTSAMRSSNIVISTPASGSLSASQAASPNSLPIAIFEPEQPSMIYELRNIAHHLQAFKDCLIGASTSVLHRLSNLLTTHASEMLLATPTPYHIAFIALRRISSNERLLRSHRNDP